MKRATCVPAFLVLSTSVLPAAELSVIPRLARLSVAEGRFALRPSTRIIAANPDSMKVALLLAGYLAPSTGWSLSVSSGDAADNTIRIDAADRSHAVGQLGREGYVLSVTPTQVRISSPSASGALWAVQTFRQLLPDGIFSRTPVEKGVWAVPCVSVSDSPRFEWRGLMLAREPY